MPRKPYQDRLSKYYEEYPEKEEIDYQVDGSRDAYNQRTQTIRNRIEAMAQFHLQDEIKNLAPSCGYGAGMNMADIRKAAKNRARRNEAGSFEEILAKMEQEFQARLRQIEGN